MPKRKEVFRNPEKREIKVGDELWKVGDQIEWLDEQTKNKFNAPAFGHGEGPFIIEGFSSIEETALIFRNAKGNLVEISAFYFKLKQ